MGTWLGAFLPSSGLQDGQACVSHPCPPPSEARNVSACHDLTARLGGSATLWPRPSADAEEAHGLGQGWVQGLRSCW